MHLKGVHSLPKPLLPGANLFLWNTKSSQHILSFVQFQLAKVSISARPFLGWVSQQRVLLPVESCTVSHYRSETCSAKMLETPPVTQHGRYQAHGTHLPKWCLGGHANVGEAFPTARGVGRAIQLQHVASLHGVDEVLGGVPWRSQYLVIQLLSYIFIIFILHEKKGLAAVACVLGRDKGRTMAMHKGGITQEMFNFSLQTCYVAMR